ncbi:MAG: TonB family protein [Bryobacterales bacterium]|nr:TonB family protein [Bryobacterales bacterium]
MNEVLWTLTGIAWKSTVLLALAALVTLLMRRRSAAARHLVWTWTFAALLAIPVFTVTLPELAIPAPPAIQATEAVVRTVVTGAQIPSAKTPGAQQSRSARVTKASPTIGWRSTILFIFAAGCLISLWRMTSNWISLWRARRHARPAGQAIAGMLRRSGGVEETVDVRVTPGGTMPMVFGVIRPTVLLPEEALDWQPERLRVVMLHELAHVRRGDVATQWMARLGVALHWWNPLAYYAWRQFLNEREHATDDLVLRAGEPPAEYAHHLLEIARTMQPSPAASVAIARKSELEGRLMAILNHNIARAQMSRAKLATALLLAIAAAAPLASLRAQQDVPLPDVDALIRRAQSMNSPEPLKEGIRAAEKARRPEIAQKLAQAALPLQAKVAGETSVEQGMLLLKLGDLQRRLGQLDEAAESYRKAVAILGDRRETSDAITFFGIRAFAKNEMAAAWEHLNKAQALNPEKSGSASMWMAMLRLKENNLKEAEALFQTALARQPADSVEAAITMELYAHMLLTNDRAQEGRAMRERADGIRKAIAVAAPPTPSEGILKIGGDVAPPSLIHKVEPAYSEEARAAKFQGTVVVAVEISADGVPQRLRVLRGLGLGLDEKALDAIAQWRFKPASKEGQPVAVAATIEVNFRLM